MEQITLYFKEGASDKVYQAAIESKGGGYVVTFAYGRRGATLTTGTKTQESVAYGRAKQLYDKLVSEKASPSPWPATAVPYPAVPTRSLGWEHPARYAFPRSLNNPRCFSRNVCLEWLKPFGRPLLTQVLDGRRTQRMNGCLPVGNFASAGCCPALFPSCRESKV